MPQVLFKLNLKIMYNDEDFIDETAGNVNEFVDLNAEFPPAIVDFSGIIQACKDEYDEESTLPKDEIYPST